MGVGEPTNGGESEGSTTAAEHEVTRLPAPPGVSRIDTLPEDFVRLLSRRPHLPGDVIANRYKLERSLGDGGMGQVFVAENMAIGRQVAIKVLRAELLADASFRARFQQEAQAIAAIEHRNVARFFDLVVGDPTFLVMEFVPGPTLSEALRGEKQLELVRALNIARRLCWALDAAHRAGVIHRDIKPGNVILAPDEELGEEPKLIDFGLAKLRSTTPENALTRAGQILGTPHYMSPEQVSDGNIDARSDVYALGCVLFHMLCGRPPFVGEEMQVLYKHLHTPPPSPSQLLPSLPARLDEILGRALAKQPAARFASMREMASALGTIDRRAPRPSAEVEPSPAPRQPPPSRRGLIAGGVVVAAAVAALGGWGVGKLQAQKDAALLISSEPQEAEVYLDGKRYRETTPTVVHGIEPGQHTLRFHLQGHADADQMVTTRAHQRSLVDVALPPEERALQVESIPSGALVYVDGHLTFGQTPVVVRLAQDDFHEVRVEKTGFAPETRAIKPEDREPVLTVHLQQEREDVGTLWVDSPASGELVLDGEHTGFNMPTVGLRVRAGRHVAELQSLGHGGAPVTFTLTKGETLRLTLPGAAP
jgi:serine/threonine protein kinase